MVDRQSTEREDIGSKPGQTNTNTKGLNYCIYLNIKVPNLELVPTSSKRSS